MKKLLFLIIVILIVLNIVDKTVPINTSTKTCLITGASSGIGYSLAQEMVNKGWTIIGLARRTEKLDQLKQKLGKKFISYKCDVSDLKQIKEISDKIKKQNLKPTLFFLNAGTGDVEESTKFSFQLHKNVFDTNYFSTIGFVEQWLNFVKELGGGTFVATSSVCAIFAPPKASAYSASKAAINKCFQALRLNYRKDNIGFVTVLPGPVNTDMLKGGQSLPFKQEPEDTAKYIVEKVFAGSKQIEPAWFYSILLRFFNCLPDSILVKSDK